MSSSAGIKIAVVAGVALAIVLFLRLGSRPPENADVDATDTKEASRDQVGQRLQQLHAAHDKSSQQAQPAPRDGGKIHARTGLTADTTRMRPPASQGAAKVPE